MANNTNQTSGEVNEIQEWEETPTDDPQEQAFQAEVNKVFQRYGRHYNNYQPCHQGSNGYRPQYNRFNQNRSGRFSSNCFNTPRHQSTTVANQAYTFNGTTAHPSNKLRTGNTKHGTDAPAMGIPESAISQPVRQQTTNASIQQLCTKQHTNKHQEHTQQCRHNHRTSGETPKQP